MKEHDNHYRHLGVMAVLSFVAMYLLMYAMVNSVDNVYMNINQVYMAGLMTAPMVIIELVVMRGMYHDKKRNAAIIGASAIVGIVLFMFIQAQTGVSDRQFLRSMIPHHASAILMCDEAPINDAEIQALCKSIRSSQQAEIDQMKAKLSNLKE